MIKSYISLGSQPIISTVLKDCGLQKNNMLLDYVGDFRFDSLLDNLNNQFKNFFPNYTEIKIHKDSVNLIDTRSYYVIEDVRNAILFYDILPIDRKLIDVYDGAKKRYKNYITNFCNLLSQRSPIIFIRQMLDDTDGETMQLYDTIKYVYPSCKFYIKHKYAGNSESSCYIYWKKNLCNSKKI